MGALSAQIPTATQKPRARSRIPLRRCFEEGSGGEPRLLAAGPCGERDGGRDMGPKPPYRKQVFLKRAVEENPDYAPGLASYARLLR